MVFLMTPGSPYSHLQFVEFEYGENQDPSQWVVVFFFKTEIRLPSGCVGSPWIVTNTKMSINNNVIMYYRIRFQLLTNNCKQARMEGVAPC